MQRDSRRLVLVTGATGFLGRYVLGALRDAGENLSLLTWDRNAFGCLQSVAARQRMWQTVNPQIVIHLAWNPTSDRNYQSGPEHREWGETSYNLARECQRSGRWLIIAGSAWDTRNETTPTNDYAEAKQRLRNQVLSLESDVSWLSPQFVFSVEDQRPRVLRELFSSPERAHFLPRNPDQLQDLIHVLDVANAFVVCLQQKLKGEIYVGSGVLRTTSALISAALRGSRCSGLPEIADQPRPASRQPTNLWDAGWTDRATRHFFRPSKVRS